VRALRLEDLFGAGVLVRHKEHELVSLLRGHRVGELAVESGRILFGDPYSFEDLAPLDVKIPKGRYPVFAGANEMDAGSDGTGLLIRLREDPVERWRSFLRRGHAFPIDGATIAIADAVAKKPLQCGVASDGGYPLVGGFDARGRLAAMAVHTLNPREYRRWPSSRSKVPPVDMTDLDACLDWALAMGGDDALVRPGSVDQRTLGALVAAAGRKPPRELVHYYSRCTPFLGEPITLDEPSALPVTITSPGHYSVYREDGIHDVYEGSTMGTSRDLRAWSVLNTISVHDLRAL
jgi:hypothetical protein